MEDEISGAAHTYTALYEEASARRAELLEVTIVALILLEIVLAIAQG